MVYLRFRLQDALSTRRLARLEAAGWVIERTASVDLGYPYPMIYIFAKENRNDAYFDQKDRRDALYW